jgi:hypothetical protein
MEKVRFLRRWSGTLLALLLTFAVLTPTVDTFICIADVGEKVVATQDQPHSGEAKQLPAQPHDDGDSSCIHGHCHHWVGYARLGERLALAISAHRASPITGTYNRPDSAPSLELLRPPQA